MVTRSSKVFLSLVMIVVAVPGYGCGGPTKKNSVAPEIVQKDTERTPIKKKDTSLIVPVADVVLDLTTSGPSWCWTRSRDLEMWTKKHNEGKYAQILLERYFLSLTDTAVATDSEFPGLKEIRQQLARGEQSFLIAQSIDPVSTSGQARVVKDVYPIVAEAFDQTKVVYYLEIINRGVVQGPDENWAIRLDYGKHEINGVDDIAHRYSEVHSFCVIPSKGKFTVFLPPSRVPDRPPHPSDALLNNKE